MPAALPDSLPGAAILAAIEHIKRKGNKLFSESTRYDLVHEGERFAPKMVVGTAAESVIGKQFDSDDFSGGVGSKCFRLLQEAGFRLEPKPGVIPFDVGHKYSRSDIGKRLLIDEDTTKGDWATGYHFHGINAENGYWFIFANEGNSAGRTGHNYKNVWIDDGVFSWEAKGGAKLSHKQLQSLTSQKHPVLLLSREEDRDKFTFRGEAIPLHVRDTVPARRTQHRFCSPGDHTTVPGTLLRCAP